MARKPIQWRRIGYAMSFLIVAGTAAASSYTHIVEVALYGHQNRLVAHLLPLSIDGMLLIATLAMAEDKAADRHPRGWARFGFWGGAVVSTAANIAATVVTWGTGPIGIAVAAVAPVMLLISIEIVARPGKLRSQASQVAAPVAPEMAAPAQELPAVMPVSPAVGMTATTGKKRQRYGARDTVRGYSDRQKQRHTKEDQASPEAATPAE